MLTKRCNQSCYYCTTYSVLEETVVDIDYLDWVLDQLPNETSVELTGGEIGLVENIDIVYHRLRRHPHIKNITALSNGLLRKRDTTWLKDIEYWEHLIYEIKGKEIIKFYQELDLNQLHKYIIVATQTTVASLLANWDYFDSMGIFEPNFDYKIMNHKSRTDIRSYTNDLIDLYSRLGNIFSKRMIMHYFMPNYIRREKELCKKWSPNTFIDFQTKQLGHCAMNVLMSNKVEFNKENLLKMINGEFSNNDYCKKCYSFDNGKNRTMFNNRSYIQ